MKRSFKLFLAMFVVLALLVSCKTDGAKKGDKPLFEKGNIYGNVYGRQMTTSRLIDVLVSIDFTGITRIIFESTSLPIGMITI